MTGLEEVKSIANPIGKVSSLLDVNGVSARLVSSKFHFSQGDDYSKEVTVSMMKEPGHFKAGPRGISFTCLHFFLENIFFSDWACS